MLSDFAVSHAACVSLARNPTAAHLESFKTVPKAKYANAALCFRTCGMCYAYSVHRSSRDHRIVLYRCDCLLSEDDDSLTTRQRCIDSNNSPPYSSAQPVRPGHQSFKAARGTFLPCTAAAKPITPDSELLTVSKLRRWPPKKPIRKRFPTRSRLSETLWHSADQR